MVSPSNGRGRSFGRVSSSLLRRKKKDDADDLFADQLEDQDWEVDEEETRLQAVNLVKCLVPSRTIGYGEKIRNLVEDANSRTEFYMKDEARLQGRKTFFFIFGLCRSVVRKL